jgi:cation:H+ antiporter
MVVVWLLGFIAGVALIVWGAEAFAEHLGAASVRLGVSAFALALLLAGAEPEELATVVVASLRGSPGIALGDVIGANVAICLVALGVGAVIAPLPFRASVLRYAVLGLPLGAIAAWVAWDGVVTRPAGALLVGLYIIYVAVIWIVERRPPALGEVHELQEAQEAAAHSGADRRVGRELFFVLAGVAAMAAGATLLVEAVQRITSVEATQTVLGLTLVGFATAFELVVLAWSAARRGASEAVVAGVIGSFAYNVTMTLGAGALARPLAIMDATRLHAPWLAMLAALCVVVLLAAPMGRLGRRAGIILLSAYPLFVLAVLLV